MGIGSSGRGRRLLSRWGAVIASAALCASLLAAAPALAGTPHDTDLGVPAPLGGPYIPQGFDESQGTLVFTVPPDSDSPYEVYAWSAAAGLTTLAPAGGESPAIDGQTVVWESGNVIYGINLSSGDTYDLDDGASQGQPDVSGEWVVWTEGLRSIHAYNLVTHEARVLSTTNSLKQCPRICGDVVVWMDDRRDGVDYDIWGCRLSSGSEFPICEADGDQMNPDTDGRYVVWSDERTANASICGYDLTTDAEFLISQAAFPDMKTNPRISDGLVAWVDGGTADEPAGLEACTLPAGVVFRVCDGGGSPIPDGSKIYHLRGSDAWCATISPITGSLALHQATVTPGFTADPTVTLDVTADSDAGTITDMNFGGGWQPIAATATVGPLADGWQTVTAQVRDSLGNIDTISSPPFYVDTIPPVTSWYFSYPHQTTPLTSYVFNRDVILHLDPTDASGVGTVYSQIDGGPWLGGGPLRFDARADHSRDGSHTVLVYSEDAAGNIEAAPQTIQFTIDTIPPAAVGVCAATARAGQTTLLRFRIHDREPATGTATVRIVIVDSAGRTILRLGAVKVPVNRNVARRFLCHLPKGSYRFGVAAVDSAGNPSVRATFNRLVVK